MISLNTALLTASMALLLGQGGSGYKVETRYPVPGNGGWDYVTIDSSARRLYLSHGTEVKVLSADGSAEKSDAAARILTVLQEDLK